MLLFSWQFDNSLSNYQVISQFYFSTQLLDEHYLLKASRTNTTAHHRFRSLGQRSCGPRYLVYADFFHHLSCREHPFALAA